ncbi:PP2C family serine/threonine-protein phosphatase [Methanoregula sp. UBA64]|uniref:PP2C family serine/threonine-protein phosphatase n=1 Tax=Methanoregula sp. UBA64 TaxID=1915554 RepID=UPI0025CCD759|nr:PP2C family serine/threonine-protein phosphatase [Methanoregula sp. UBA64]
MSWKHLSLSVTGSSHSARNEPGQDYCRAGALRFSDRDYFVGLAADGAGSTSRGGTGAEIACETLYARILDAIRGGENLPRDPETGTVAVWITSCRDAIARRAVSDGLPLREYACTLIGVVATEGYLLCFQVGDGCIVMGDGTGYRTVFWPEQGEYANTTFFITDDAFAGHIRTEYGTTCPAEIALFTDGLQNLVLSFSTRTVHEGFFKPLFAALRKNPENGFVDLSGHLRALLSSDDVNARSDDDKTLVLAVNPSPA